MLLYITRIYDIDIDNDGDFDIIPCHKNLDDLFVNKYWENIVGTFMRIN